MPQLDPAVLTVESCEINILIVADRRILNGLTLDRLISVLKEDIGNYARFHIHTAHRDSVGGVDMPNYKFDQDAPLDKYDEIWLFGDQGPKSDGSVLPDIELNEIAKFMNKGGGIFATGDHGELGAFLNGKILRVRSMRKWFSDDTRYPEFPTVEEPRNDTLEKGINNDYRSSYQEDEHPQKITCARYPLARHAFFEEKFYVHPLLSTANGAMDVLPDHMHEGECYIPSSLSLSEFPSKDGLHPMPLVIAISKPQSHPTFDEVSRIELRPTKASPFGAIGAYDGHKIELGRVVVDSSFHHFIDLNLKGFEMPGVDPITLAKIKNYYRNIRLWIVPKHKQRRIFFSFLLEGIRITLFPTNIYDDKYFTREVGAKVRETLNQFTSPSFVLQWSLDLISQISNSNFLKYICDPWLSQQDSYDASRLLLDTEILIDYVIGGAVIKCLTTPTEDVENVIEEGAKEGIKEFLQDFRELSKTLNHTRRMLKKHSPII